MDSLASPEPEIIVEQPEGSDEEMEEAASIEAMDVDFSTDFLHAKTRSFRQGALRPADHPMDWDQYVVTSAADIESKIAVGPTSTSSLEIGTQISDICAYLIGVFSDMGKYTKFLSYRGEAAQDLLDLLQKLLDHDALEAYFRSILYVALVRLCRKSELYPRCFSLTGVDANFADYPLSSGGFGDVYKALYQGKPICLKVLKMYQRTNRSEASLLNKSFSREAVVWGQLSHPNILPFIGIYRLKDEYGRLCLVSPWMDYGNINDYLKSRPQVDRTTLISDIAAGMEYLHRNGVVHGDIKSLNILVTASERACLADFGLSYVSDATGLKGQALSSNHAEGGTQGFEAPELVDPEADFTRKTEASDVYAFGMVCYEMLAGQRPFGKVKPIAVISKIMKGQYPERPRGKVYLARGLTDTMWTLMKRCWSTLPTGRPTATQISQSIPRVEMDLHDVSWAHTRRPAFDTSSGQPDLTITNALSHLKSI